MAPVEGTPGRFDEIIPSWLLAVRSPALRILIGFGVPTLVQLGLDEMTNAS